MKTSNSVNFSTSSESRSTKNGPFIWASKAALQVLRNGTGENADNSARARSVYIALCELASDCGGETFTETKALIGYRAGLSVRSVQRALPDLESLGLIKVLRSEQGVKAASTYELLKVASSCSQSGRTIGQNDGSSHLADKVRENERTEERKGEKEAPAPVSFPWKCWNDLGEENRRQFESRFDRLWLQETFSSIRGRKISFKDRHLASDWPDVLRSEIEAAARVRTAPHSNCFPFPEGEKKNLGQLEAPFDWYEQIAESAYGPGGRLEVTCWEELPLHAQKVAIERSKTANTTAFSRKAVNE